MHGIPEKYFENKRLFIVDSCKQFLGFCRENVIERRGDDSAGDRKTEKNQDHCHDDGYCPEERGKDHPVPGITLGYVMHNYGVEKRESPEDSDTQNYEVDKKRHNDVLEKNGMAFNEFSCPERVEESLGKIGDRIVFQIESHSFLI